MGVQQNNSMLCTRAYDLPSHELLTKFYSIVNKFPPAARPHLKSNVGLHQWAHPAASQHCSLQGPLPVKTTDISAPTAACFALPVLGSTVSGRMFPGPFQVELTMSYMESESYIQLWGFTI